MTATETVTPTAVYDVRASYKWWALSATSLGTLLSTLNTGTLVIALPALLRDLHASLLTLVWVLLSYTLVQTVVVLAAGRLADILGRKSLYVAGFALFSLAALACGFMHYDWQLVVCRIVQGVGGALILANSSAIVTDAFPRQQLGMALGTNVMIAAVGMAVGPVLGGWLTSLGWQWVFWFNVPLGVIGTVWAAIVLRDVAVLNRQQRFDMWGTLCYASFLTALLIALSSGGIMGWTQPGEYVAGVIAVVMLPAFLWVELHTDSPLLNLELFRQRIFLMGNLSTLLNALSRQALIFLLVFYFQGPEHDDPITAGVKSVPLAIGMLVSSPIAGIMSDRLGSRVLSTVGMIVSAAGLFLLIPLSVSTSYVSIAIALTLVGLGSGLFNSPNASAIMMSVPPGQRGIASGTRMMMMNTGGVISIAAALAVVTATIPRPVMFALFAGVTAGVPTSAVQGFINGLHHSFLVMGVISLAGAVASYARGQHVVGTVIAGNA